MIKHKQHGFTLVELLIVIVIIAILAAITVVAYNGIQNRANDSAVQSDLRNFANLVLQYQVVNDIFPVGTGRSVPGAAPKPTMDNFHVAQQAYATNVHNFIYCQGTVSGQDAFAIGAMSKSGNMYAYYSNGGLKQYTGSWYGGAVASVCPALGITPPQSGYFYSYGYNNPLGWSSWTS